MAGTNLYAGTLGGVFMSTNNGTNWTVKNGGLSGSGLLVHSLASNASNIFAGTEGGIYLSTNSGTNWISRGLTNLTVTQMIFIGSNLIATTSSGIYSSTNNGLNWLNQYTGFSIAPGASSIVYTNQYFFVGTVGQSVWRRDSSDIFTNLKIHYSGLPDEYLLFQNYPNPFNPTTIIQYALPKFSFIKLEIFDMLGRKIETLVNEKQTAGVYETKFNASQYQNGVYFYRLTAEGFRETKKMILIK
jgi:hypothetical protein